MSEKHTVRETVFSRGVWGSLVKANKYEDDTLVQVRKWIDDMLEKIPPAFRSTARISIDSEGGYEGEHHVEVAIYYDRPETKAEKDRRLADEAGARARREADERRAYEALKKKFET